MLSCWYDIVLLLVNVYLMRLAVQNLMWFPNVMAGTLSRMNLHCPLKILNYIHIWLQSFTHLALRSCFIFIHWLHDFFPHAVFWNNLGGINSEGSTVYLFDIFRNHAIFAIDTGYLNYQKFLKIPNVCWDTLRLKCQPLSTLFSTKMLCVPVNEMWKAAAGVNHGVKMSPSRLFLKCRIKTKGT